MTGLDGKQLNQNYSFLKGRLAEAIIEQIFIQLEYKVFRYGIENTVPGIVDIVRNQKGSVIESIRNQPDFVVQSQTNDWFFLEVKYRSELKLNVKELLKYKFPEVQFIIITPEFIGSISKEELEKLSKQGVKTVTEVTNLSNSLDFNFSENEKISISQFEIYTNAFFKDLPTYSEICKQAEEYI